MEKLGLGTASATPPSPSSAPQAGPSPQAAWEPSPAHVGPKGVDVVAKLEGLAAAHKEKLNWKTSILDLMRLLGLDSSLVVRKNWRLNWGPARKMGDSAQMNVWLHKTVLQKLADNGGNVPKELLQARSLSESQQAKSTHVSSVGHGCESQSIH